MAAEGGRVGWHSQGLVDRLQDAGEIAVYVAVPKSENAKIGFFERAVAALVASLVSIEIVLPAVDFDDQAVFEADKVHYESLARRLPPKMITAVSP